VQTCGYFTAKVSKKTHYNCYWRTGMGFRI